MVIRVLTDAEQLALTEQLFDAALGDLGVVAGEQPCLIVGSSTWSPPKSIAWQKGFRLGSGLHVWYVGKRVDLGENCRQNLRKTSFSRFWVFYWVVETLPFGGEVHLCGICGLAGPDILVLILLVLWWRSLMLVGGLRMVTWSWMWRLIFWLKWSIG